MLDRLWPRAGDAADRSGIPGGRNRTDAATLASLVAGHDNALAVALDVTDAAAIKHAVQQADAKFGQIDVLANNADYGYLAAIEEGEDGPVRAMFDTNFFGLVAVTKALLPGMRARKCGHIVNRSSIGGLVSFVATGYYHATKFAVEGLSGSMALELMPLGIKVTVVEPGPFRTDFAGRSIGQLYFTVSSNTTNNPAHAQLTRLSAIVVSSIGGALFRMRRSMIMRF